MAEWIQSYQKGVVNSAPAVSKDDWQRYESEVTEHPPADLKALYSVFNGGELNGGARLYTFDRVVNAREHSEDSTWVFGEKGNQRLIASRKATLASHPGLQIRPTWFEMTAADELVFAVHDSRGGSVRVYPSLEQLLAVLVPPAQLEAFGDHTYARAMAAVENVINNVTAKVKQALPKVGAKNAKKAPPAKTKRAGAKSTAKSRGGKSANAGAGRSSAKKGGGKSTASARGGESAKKRGGKSTANARGGKSAKKGGAKSTATARGGKSAKR